MMMAGLLRCSFRFFHFFDLFNVITLLYQCMASYEFFIFLRDLRAGGYVKKKSHEEKKQLEKRENSHYSFI